MKLEWIQHYAGPGCERYTANIGWLEIELWVPERMDAYFNCQQVGYKQYTTHTKDVGHAKDIAATHVLTRLQSLIGLARLIQPVAN